MRTLLVVFVLLLVTGCLFGIVLYWTWRVVLWWLSTVVDNCCVVLFDGRWWLGVLLVGLRVRVGFGLTWWLVLVCLRLCVSR